MLETRLACKQVSSLATSHYPLATNVFEQAKKTELISGKFIVRILAVMPVSDYKKVTQIESNH